MMADAGMLEPTEAGETSAGIKKRIDLVFCTVTTNCLMTFD